MKNWDNVKEGTILIEQCRGGEFKVEGKGHNRGISTYQAFGVTSGQPIIFLGQLNPKYFEIKEVE